MARQKRYKGYLRESFTYNGKRYYVYAYTKDELSDKVDQKKADLKKGIEAVYNPTLRAYYSQLLDIRRRELKESTLRAQNYQFENMANVPMSNGLLFGDMHIKDITRRNIEYVRSRLLEQGKTPQNLNICFAHLNHVFSCATVDDTIEKNPCKALKPLKREDPYIKENKHRALTIDETRRFFEAAAERHSYYKGIFEAMIKTGMRIGEITALYPFDVDRKNGFIHIRRTVSRDEAGAYFVSENTKTTSGKRDIPLTDEVYAIIKEQEAMNRMLFFEDDNGLLFKSSEGNILREYTLNREIKRICLAADLEPFTCHAFRNTFATRFIEQRPQDYKILSEILGHKDIAITLNLYTHVMTDNKVNAMNEIRIKTS